MDSLSASLMVSLHKFRNPKEPTSDPFDDNLNTIDPTKNSKARRLVAELGYITAFVLALLETVIYVSLALTLALRCQRLNKACSSSVYCIYSSFRSIFANPCEKDLLYKAARELDPSEEYCDV